MKDREKGGIPLEDSEIIRLYWERDEAAIAATSEKYGGYCAAIAASILGNREDAEECVSDTYLRAWNAIPPHRPAVLPVFLGKITRNLSFNRYRRNRAEKRGGGETAAVLEELSQIVSGGPDAEQALQYKELVAAIDAFLDTLPPEKQGIFLCRYWYTDSIAAIAGRYGMGEGAVSMALSRLRRRLRDYLLERGFTL